MSYMNHRDPLRTAQHCTAALGVPGPVKGARARAPCLSALLPLLLLALSCTRSRTSTTTPFFPQHHHLFNLHNATTALRRIASTHRIASKVVVASCPTTNHHMG